MALINILDGVTSLSEWVGKNIRVRQGVDTLLISPACGQIDSVIGQAPGEVVIMEDPEDTRHTTFALGDIVLICPLDSEIEDGVTRIFRTVAAISGKTVTMAPLDGASADIGRIARGDTMVAIGIMKDA